MILSLTILFFEVAIGRSAELKISLAQSTKLEYMCPTLRILLFVSKLKMIEIKNYDYTQHIRARETFQFFST